MKDLIYKEVTFSVNRFFYVFPFLLALLMFIPNWIFSLVYMYFFWITVSQIVVNYTATSDYMFLSMLPVSKKDIVSSKIIAFIILEIVHLISLLVLGFVHIKLYGTWNFFMEINPLFYGVAFAAFGIFNIIFLPQYFKTAYKFGKPVIAAITIVMIFVGFFEYSSVGIPVIRDFMKSPDLLIQLGSLSLGLIIFFSLNYLAIKSSITNFENIN